MGGLLLLALGYLACSVAAFWLLQHDWRRTLDVDTEVLGVMLLMSVFGPFSLAIALVITGVHLLGVFVFWAIGPKRTIWQRRK